MWPLDVFGLFVLVLTLCTMLVIVLLLAGKTSGKDVPIWLASSLVGILLGAGALAALTRAMGYEVVDTTTQVFLLATDSSASPTAGRSMPAMGGGMPGMGGGMGGNRGPSPKRQLTTLVRKLDLLSGEIAVNLTPDQAAAVVALVADLDGLKKLSDDDAKAKYEEILAVLTDDQRTKEDAVGLPTRRPTGGGAGGAPGGGPPPDPNANPFHEEENATALKSLRGRIGTLVAVSAEAEPENKPAP